MNKFLLSAAFAAVTLAATPAIAADALIMRLSSLKLSAVLIAMGAKEVAVKRDSADLEFVSFNDGNGPVDFALSECNADGCQSLQMFILYDLTESKKISLATLNSFNGKYLDAQVAQLEDGAVIMSDLFVTTGGVSEDNLKENISIFLNAPRVFATHLKEQKIASNAVQAQPVGMTPAMTVQTGIATQRPRLQNAKILQILSRPNRRPGRPLG
ncbi:MAG: YbjN domain-containing protein [Alphaproteobacteria bacterium]|nr:YbjN domain-containing protein [Alphaproteobacteria bacterium]